MERRKLHIGWLLSGIVLMLLTACSSSDNNGMEGKQPTLLTLYVYSPDRPMLIRSAFDEVNPSAEESKITRLQIWIFENTDDENNGKKVAYFDTGETSLLSAGEGATYQIPVSDDFAQRKPHVDVYVIANLPVGEYGNTLNKESTREQVLAATIPDNYFGLSSHTTKVPEKEGLPMAGKLENQPVNGVAPVLRVGTTTNIATVQLTRCVSKVRFVFANATGSSDLYITGITLGIAPDDVEMIPKVEYLIPRTPMVINGGYNNDPEILFSGSVKPVASVDDPTIYIYNGQEAQEYEDLINTFINNNATNDNLIEVGPFYLHESDKRLKGKITYTIGSSNKEATFQMAAEGDFSRNHTWIVYAYHLGGGFLEMNTLYLKDWINKEVDHGVYNW